MASLGESGTFPGRTAGTAGTGQANKLKLELRGRAESAGINRHRVGDERALHERRSCSIMAPSHARAIARLHVKR
jgi:hypothetical protein